MMARTHALSGAVAFLACTPLAHLAGLTLDPITAITASVAAAGGAMLPDLDHPSALAANSLGPVTKGVAAIIHEASGGHRQGTHSLIGAAFFLGCALAFDIAGGMILGLWLAFLFAIAVAAVRMTVVKHLWLHTGLCLAGGAVLFTESTVLNFLLPILTIAVVVGVLAHIVGDMLTEQGCPLLWPFSEHRFRLARFTTNGPFERFAIGPALSVAAGVLTYFTVTGW